MSEADNAAADAAAAGYGSDTVGAGAMDGLSSAGIGFAAETIGTSGPAYDLSSEVTESTNGLAGFMDSLGIHAASMSAEDISGYGAGGNDTGNGSAAVLGGWGGGHYEINAAGYPWWNNPYASMAGGGSEGSA